MIPTLMKISWLNLKRDYVALGLTFVLPIIFFSIFAVIFGSMSGGSGGGAGDNAMKVIVVDQDGTDVSRRFVKAIDGQDALKVIMTPTPSDEVPDPAPYTRETARKTVRGGGRPVAIIIPEGFGASFGTFAGDGPAVEVIYDAANPIAAPTVSGLLQASAMMAAPDVLMEQGLGQLEKFGEALTPKQREAVDAFLPALRGDTSFESIDELFAGKATGDDAAHDDATHDDPTHDDPTHDDPTHDDPTGADAATDDEATSGEETSSAFAGLVKVKTIDARAEDEVSTGDAKEPEPSSMVAYYAAGVGVMFLLFSMAGAGGALLEEEENGTLERLLTTHVRMRTLLLGNWLFFGLVGALQVITMFVWGAFVFGLDLFTPNHLAGFAAMTVVTAAAAAAFGIVLATLCKSRAQLSGISTIIILIMSALGGSMMPKFVAPDLFALTSAFTFNGWALDGYLKVFWYDDPAAGMLASVASLWPQLLVLTGLTALFLAVARLLARRWETA